MKMETLEKHLSNAPDKDNPDPNYYDVLNDGRITKAVAEWLIEKYRTIMEGCDNPCCPFCNDVKEKKGMVDHIFEGFLLEYTAKLPAIVVNKPTKAEGT
jgi:hypothetical protein